MKSILSARTLRALLPCALVSVAVTFAGGAGFAAAEENTAAANKKICKMVKIPGNRTKTKLCKRQAFWDEQAKIEKKKGRRRS